MRLLFAGTPEVAVPALDAVRASRHEVVAVVTRPDARSGRGRAVSPSPIRAAAEAVGIEVLTPRRPSDPEFLERLRRIAPDACPIVAYGGLIPAAALAVPAYGWVNLHFSLLPAWRGAAPVQHAVIAGDEFTGATTFLLDEGLDTGPVLGAMTERIHPTDTSGDLLARLSEAGAGLLVASLDALEDGTATPVAQPADGVSLAPKLTVEDAHVRWNDPALAVDRRIRGCTPAPGAWSVFRGQRLGIEPLAEVTRAQLETPLAAGEILAGKKDVLVGTSTGAVRLGGVRPAGKKAMAAADWARGVRTAPGERFDT